MQIIIASDCKERGDPGFWIALSLLLLATTGMQTSP